MLTWLLGVGNPCKISQIIAIENSICEEHDYLVNWFDSLTCIVNGWDLLICNCDYIPNNMIFM